MLSKIPETAFTSDCFNYVPRTKYHYGGCHTRRFFTLSYDYGISADVSILVTGFGRFGTVFIYALFGLKLGNPV